MFNFFAICLLEKPSLKIFDFAISCKLLHNLKKKKKKKKKGIYCCNGIIFYLFIFLLSTETAMF